MKNLETEIKWDATAPRAFMRMLYAAKKIAGKAAVSAAQVLYITDVYLDHPDETFAKQKIAFRLRHYAQTWEATFKTRTQLVNGKAVRREETQTLAGVQNLSHALAKLDVQKRWKNLTVGGLVPLFRIRNKRRARLITAPHFQAELAFDTCVVCAGEKRVFMKEIELELKHGRAEDFDNFAAQLSSVSGLPRATQSKVKTAHALLKGENIK